MLRLTSLYDSEPLVADPADDGARLEGGPGDPDATGADARVGEQIRGLRLAVTGGELTAAVEREGAV